MEDALSHVEWRERGEGRKSHSKSVRWRLNERKKGSGRGSHLAGGGVLSGGVKYHVICKTLRGWHHFSPLLTFLPPSLPPSQSSPVSPAQGQIAVHRQTMDSTAFHACCHRHIVSCRENSKQGLAQGCQRAADEWQTDWGSVTLTYVCQVWDTAAYSPPAPLGFVLFS